MGQQLICSSMAMRLDDQSKLWMTNSDTSATMPRWLLTLEILCSTHHNIKYPFRQHPETRIQLLKCPPRAGHPPCVAPQRRNDQGVHCWPKMPPRTVPRVMLPGVLPWPAACVELERSSALMSVRRVLDASDLVANVFTPCRRYHTKASREYLPGAQILNEMRKKKVHHNILNPIKQ